MPEFGPQTNAILIKLTFMRRQKENSNACQDSLPVGLPRGVLTQFKDQGNEHAPQGTPLSVSQSPQPHEPNSPILMSPVPQARIPKRMIPSESFQAKDPKRKFPSERSQAKAPERKFTSESSQAEVGWGGVGWGEAKSRHQGGGRLGEWMPIHFTGGVWWRVKLLRKTTTSGCSA